MHKTHWLLTTAVEMLDILKAPGMDCLSQTSSTSRHRTRSQLYIPSRIYPDHAQPSSQQPAPSSKHDRWRALHRCAPERADSPRPARQLLAPRPGRLARPVPLPRLRPGERGAAPVPARLPGAGGRSPGARQAHRQRRADAHDRPPAHAGRCAPRGPGRRARGDEQPRLRPRAQRGHPVHRHGAQGVEQGPGRDPRRGARRRVQHARRGAHGQGQRGGAGDRRGRVEGPEPLYVHP
ncbi:hypothetical protein CALCODRAFT_310785 [Calocera cornea HHB12733]|uniref:Uncharacterized protein n=1 Tax=Calocera cornea HHB12733 TaxID=1353952 RepID=A0A165FF58_9BASI|nr:hypothetical protein CALCODRAFT_310785 [Calocera cornea HHB12733]